MRPGPTLLFATAILSLTAAVLATTGPGARAQGAAPQAEITSAPTTTFKRRPSFEFRSDSGKATFECSTDGAGWRTCASPHRADRLALGAHTFSVRAVDVAGAGDPASAELRIVDTRIRRLERATFERRPRARFALAGGKGVESSFECAVDKRRYRACASPFRPGRLGYGRHSIRVRAATPEAGQDPSSARRSFRVERRRVEFGQSVGGRKLVAIRLGDPAARRSAIVFGSIHGDETEGHEVFNRLRGRYRNASGVDLWAVKTVNPDGVARKTRKNAHGVDLNRNFSYRWSGAEPPSSGYYGGPKPFSEPEARAVKRLEKRVRPNVTIWYHQPWGAVLVPCSGNAPIQREYARIASMRTSCRGDGLPGTATSWQNHRLPGTAFVVEFAAGELANSSARRHARAAVKVARR